jgi:3-hydroxyisobutyrate dehydrogenase-like beta-hydroxyacid dehydrogenase
VTRWPGILALSSGHALVGVGFRDREFGIGVRTLDAPINGGSSGSNEGTVSIVVSGPEDAFSDMVPILPTLGKAVAYCGEKAGLAQVAKLANNILSATALAASLEALAMGVKAGLDPTTMLRMINAGSGRNSATEDKLPRDVITGKRNYGAPIRILMKDIDFALAEGEAQGVPQMVCQQVRQMYEHRDASRVGAARNH